MNDRIVIEDQPGRTIQPDEAARALKQDQIDLEALEALERIHERIEAGEGAQ